MFQVLHRDARTLSDKFASGLVRFARFMFDLVSGYKHAATPPNEKMSLEELRKGGYLLDHHAWLNVSDANMVPDASSSCSCQRILFLESIAGVPGMVAATMRHLSSLRLMVRTIFIFRCVLIS
jgi:hypothetical protein